MKQNAWFQLHLEADGYGWAKFQDPDAVIEGPAKFRFDEYGESTIELSVENVKSKEPLPLGLFQLLSGNKVESDGKTLRLGVGRILNKCTKFEIATSEGTLVAREQIHYSYQIGSQGSKIFLSALNPEYIVTQPQEPKYWVIPLSNFVPDFRNSHPSLDNHPLRISPTPINIEGLIEEEIQIASSIVNKKNKLIVFEFNQALGFIEPLPDYSERKESLVSRKAINKITSMMIGEVGENSIEFEDIRSWLPIDFLLLLGLAGGTEVGSPWIEFRDENGDLVKRIHYSLGQPRFSKGHTAIDERFHSGIGYLLSKAQNSPKFNQSFLRVALKNIVRAGLHSYAIEDKLRHVFIVFDNLIIEYGLNRELPLQNENQKLVDNAIKEARKTIKKLSRKTRENGDEAEAELLTKIAEKVGSSKKIRPGFGSNVIDLMKEFKLDDHEVVSKYYKENPRPDKRKWVDIISRYRGIVMHRSYFNFREGDHDIEEVYRCFYHWHDILVRIVMKILDYDGTYQPTTIHTTTDLSVDWVNLDTKPSLLGYD